MKPGMRRLLAGAALVLFGAGIGWFVAIRSGGRTEAPAAAETIQLWTCGMHPQVLQDHPGSCPICHMALVPVRTATAPGAGSEDMPANAVLIDPVIVQNMGLRLAPATLGAVDTRVSAVGTLLMDETRVHAVTLKVDGWIDRLYAATIGQPIRRGEVLFDFYSPELAVAVEEYRGAIVARDARDAPGADTEPHGMEAIAAAARARLLQWDVTPGDLNAALLRYTPRLTMPVRSSVNGTLLEKSVNAGDAVMAGAVLFRIADLSTLWLDASLYESQAVGVTTGDAVRAVISGDSGPPLEGKVVFISPLLDPVTRVTTVRMEFPNPDLRYRPGMFARVEFAAPGGPDGVTVPREAIIDTGRRQIVFVTRGRGRFEPRLVRMGRVTDDGQAEVLSGLAVGDTVVVSGQFLLDAESRTQEAIQKMLDHRGHGAGGGR